MVTFTKSELAALFPEFAGETEARVAATLTLARDFVDEDTFGTKARTALMLYTAHLLAKANQGASGASGPVQSERVGDLSRSYATSGGDSASTGLNSTVYGQQFRKLASNELVGGGVFVQDSFTEPES